MPSVTEKEKLLRAVCMQHALDLLLVDSDEDEVEDAIEQFGTDAALLLDRRRSVNRRSEPRSQLHELPLNFSLPVNSSEFEYILNLIKNDVVFRHRMSVVQLPVRVQLQITIFRVGAGGTGFSIRRLANLFGVGNGGTVEIVTRRVFRALLNLKHKFLNWPNMNERRQLVAETINDLPGCIGFMGTTKFNLIEIPERRYNTGYCIKMLAICDNNYRIRHATLANEADATDYSIYAKTTVAKRPQAYFSKRQWIAAGSAYFPERHVITPFDEHFNGTALSTVQTKFNSYYEQYLRRVEKCFTDLKENFGSLKEIKFRNRSAANHGKCCDWILACCILHNMVITYNKPSMNDETAGYASQYLKDFTEPDSIRISLTNFVNKHCL